MTFALSVPGTDIALTEHDGLLVGGDMAFGTVQEGIWDLVRAERKPTLDAFASDYAAVRRAEERELTPGEVQTLPVVRPDHPLAAMWQERAASYARFKQATAHVAIGAVIDIGAGCGWLAADFAQRGWQAAAVDVTVDGGDGLASARYHGVDMVLARAEMEALPFESASVDLAVFNASLHYAHSVVDALTEASRVLRPGGTLAVVDSPVFADPAAGARMVDELATYISCNQGVAAAQLEGPGFVSEADVDLFDFVRIEQTNGLRKRLHAWRGTRRAGRETASRPLLITTIGDRS